VCEREICYLGYVEPSNVVVLCRRSINGISAPLLDEPDPQDESGLNDSYQFGPRLLDQYSQLLFQLTSQRLDRRFPVLHMPTGKVPYIWVPSPTSGAVAQQHSAVAHQERGHDFMGFRCARSHCIHLQTLSPQPRGATHARVTFANAGPCGGLLRHAGRSCARSSRDLRLDGGPEPPSPLITGAGGGSFAAKDVHPAADPSNCPGPRITLPAFGLRLNASDHAGFVVYGMYSQRMMPARSYQRRTLRGKGDRRRQ